MATQIIRSKSPSGWPSRNIHISNGSFPFYVDYFFPLSPTRLLPDLTVYMNNTVGVLTRSWNRFTMRASEFNTPCFFCGVGVAHHFSFWCCVFVLYVFFLCLVPNVFCVSWIPPPSFTFSFEISQKVKIQSPVLEFDLTFSI